MRRERTGSASQRLPPYSARSPTMAHYSYSPTNGPPPPATYGTAYASRPSSSAAMNVPSPLGPSQSPRLGPPRSPTNGLPQLSRAAYTPREQSKNTYYDPTSDHRETPSTWSQSPYANRSPVQVSYCLGIEACLLLFKHVLTLFSVRYRPITLHIQTLLKLEATITHPRRAIIPTSLPHSQTCMPIRQSFTNLQRTL